MKLSTGCVIALAAIAGVTIIGILGWGLAFGFAYKVFIPWLGVVPIQYHRLAAVICGFVFDGIGSAIVLAALAGIGAVLLGIGKLIFGRR